MAIVIGECGCGCGGPEQARKLNARMFNWGFAQFGAAGASQRRFKVKTMEVSYVTLTVAYTFTVIFTINELTGGFLKSISGTAPGADTRIQTFSELRTLVLGGTPIGFETVAAQSYHLEWDDGAGFNGSVDITLTDEWTRAQARVDIEALLSYYQAASRLANLAWGSNKNITYSNVDTVIPGGDGTFWPPLPGSSPAFDPLPAYWADPFINFGVASIVTSDDPFGILFPFSYFARIEYGVESFNGYIVDQMEWQSLQTPVCVQDSSGVTPSAETSFSCSNILPTGSKFYSGSDIVYADTDAVAIQLNVYRYKVNELTNPNYTVTPCVCN